MNFFKTIKNVKNVNPGILKTIKNIADDYGPEILTIVGVLSHAGSVWAAFKAADDIVDIKERYERTVSNIEKTANESTENISEYDNEEIRAEIKTAKKEARITRNIRYVGALKWAIGLHLVGDVCDIASNRISGSKIAGLTVALAASEDKIKKLMKSVKNKVSVEDFKDIRDDFRKEVLGEQMEKGVPFDTSKNSNGDNEMLIFDSFLMAPFWGNPTQVQEAIDLANDYIKRNHVLNYNKWRGFLGLPDCPAGADAEWNPLNPFNAKLGTMIYQGDEVLTIEYGDSGESMPTSRKTLKKINNR